MPEFQPLRMERAKPCRVGPQDQSWLTAPQAPIRRWPLEREAPESGQVTSLVEYLPGARFPAHYHPAGEEILVLDGVFSDQSGDFPAGSYLRSPAGSSHAPFSQSGCVIFVKLNQFAAEDRQALRLLPEAVPSQAFAPGITGQLLHEHGPEQTWLLSCADGARLVWTAAPAAELLVLSGVLQEGEVRTGALSWLRDPALGELGLLAAAPTRVLLKIGALRGL
ncbi:cupin domain-containing protein [Halopseudomonas pachastrellae]|uniref:cupin domain-containing protein n=1 Tax=Halopseudomonas pachastrellae TaxID=254161 RepID=UPI003D7DD4C7